jgi:hypothetical protein
VQLAGLASPPHRAKPGEPPPHQKEESPRRTCPFREEVLLEGLRRLRVSFAGGCGKASRASNKACSRGPSPTASVLGRDRFLPFLRYNAHRASPHQKEESPRRTCPLTLHLSGLASPPRSLLALATRRPLSTAGRSPYPRFPASSYPQSSDAPSGKEKNPRSCTGRTRKHGRESTR